MNRSSVSLTFGVLVLIVCLCHVVSSDKTSIRRQKRGFRGDAATRVAHGFGKRGYLNPRTESSLQFSLGAADNSPHSLEDVSDGTLMTVEDFAQLLSNHPNLGKALLKKFVDIDGEKDHVPGQSIRCSGHHKGRFRFYHCDKQQICASFIMKVTASFQQMNYSDQC